jgi:hypothetical protein
MALFVGDPSAPTRFGTDVADTSDETGLFLKIFGGEVFAAFSETVLMMDKHFVREIPSGKSAQFCLGLMPVKAGMNNSVNCWDTP